MKQLLLILILGMSFLSVNGQEESIVVDNESDSVRALRYPLFVKKVLFVWDYGTDTNFVSIIPQWLFKLENLEEFATLNCRIKSLEGIGKFKALKRLDIQKGRLRELPSELPPNLEYLDISWNQLTSISDNIAQLKNLRLLSLDHNQITHLPADLAIKILSLDANNLSNIPPEIYTYKNLWSLDLGGNKFKSVPKRLLKLDKLEYITFSQNKLKRVPYFLRRLPNLKQLDISQNQISNINHITRLKKLLHVEVTHNKIEHLPKNVGEMKSINYNHNPVFSVPDKSNCGTPTNE